MRRSRSGFTLIELMVASTLALVVLTLVVGLFIPALRAWGDGQKRSEVGQSLLVTTTWLGDDVVRASPGSIKLTDEKVLIMKCARGLNDEASNPFDQVTAYWLENGDIFRVSQTVTESSPAVSTIAELKAVPDLRKVASNVTVFDVKVPESWRVELVLAVDKLGRKGEIRTGYVSIYAPLDLEIAARNAATTGD